MFISFAWTTKAFLSGEKTETRRYWKDKHAEKFNVGDIVDAYDKIPLHDGKKIGRIRLINKPFQQRTSKMTEDDYEREGLLWMEQNGLTIHGKKPSDFFEEWKKKDDLVWVVEFRKLDDDETA